MLRDILIVHDSSEKRKIAASCVLAEFPGAEIEAAVSIQWGLSAVNRKRFDVILAAPDCAGMDVETFYHRIQKAGLNKTTPILVMAESGDGDEKRRLAGAGLDHVLAGPFTSEQLAVAMERIIDPRRKRLNARYHIPGARAAIHLVQGPANADVLNFSLTGALCEFGCPQDLSDSLAPRKIDLIFPEEYAPLPVRGILASILRLEVLDRNRRYDPVTIRAAHRFEEIPPEARIAMEDVLERAARRLRMIPEAIEPEEDF